MPEVPLEDGGLYAAEIESAVAELNAEEARKPSHERREFIALGKKVESTIFRGFNAQGGLMHWFVIAGDTTGRWYLAAPICVNGFGLTLESRRIFSRAEMEREENVLQGSMSNNLNDALNRLGASVRSLSQEVRAGQSI
ncbi:hypothetical protein HY213_01280 [Candidatus Peregrinibacteria bacterium]|nr:hypothetical protein [Candidatus Peregrinibacteria bacterium]